MIDIESLLLLKKPSLAERPLQRRLLVKGLSLLTRADEVNAFLARHGDLSGLDFLDKVLEHFNFSYSLPHRERANIPANGRVVIVANHPFGALDGLALLKLVSEVRRDVRIVATEHLNRFTPLQPLFIGVDNFSSSGHRRSIKQIIAALEREEAVIIFPSGTVSRMTPSGVKDPKWHHGFLHFARKTGAPILPVHLGGRNSRLFYSASALYAPLGTLLLAREMFNKRNVDMAVRIGKPIPARHFGELPLAQDAQVKLVRKHLYRLAKAKPPIFVTENTVAHPQNRQDIKRELKQAELLGATSDGKRIYLADYRPESALMKEIGRLREMAFRQVGEGTGERLDLDRYDRYYRHIVLWDDEELEIAGAYRIADAAQLHQQGRPLYTEELFNYAAGMGAYFAQGLELGRSFVQPRYWGKRSLDYLWQGIGAYLRQHPEIRYLFGPVSISGQYPDAARQCLVQFYRQHFADHEGLARARNPLPAMQAATMPSHDYRTAFAELREQLSEWGVAVPTLYKQYSELCEPGGVRFIDFGIDPDFGWCVDGLVLVDLDKLEARKRARYLGDALVSFKAA